MTLPQLIKNYQGRILYSQLQRAYSILSQALQRMNFEEEQTVNAENYPGTFAAIYIKYFNTLANCSKNGCEVMIATGSTNYDSSEWLKSNTYKIYSLKSNLVSSFLDDGQFITADDMFLMIENVTDARLYITVDVNGKNKRPNAWGHDLFTFQVMDNGKLLPMGAEGTHYTNHCSASSSNSINGI